MLFRSNHSRIVLWRLPSAVGFALNARDSARGNGDVDSASDGGSESDCADDDRHWWQRQQEEEDSDNLL